MPRSERLLRSIQDPSTNARDDKDHFCLQRSFGARGFAAPKDDKKLIVISTEKGEARRVEKSCAARIGYERLCRVLPCFCVQDKIPPLASLGRDDKDSIIFRDPSSLRSSG